MPGHISDERIPNNVDLADDPAAAERAAIELLEVVPDVFDLPAGHLREQGFEFVGLGPREYLFTPTAVMIGLVYGFLPFMILPLYASIERIDDALLEASRDLYANGFQTFRRVLFPLSMPGVVAGSILVFVPSLGAYVTPEILGGSKTTLLGSYIVTQFLTGLFRHFPIASKHIRAAHLNLADIPISQCFTCVGIGVIG